MDARITKPEFDSAIPSAAQTLDAARTVALEAMRARDEAIGQWIRKAVTSAFRAIIDYPRRRRVYDELAMLTDRELADIGLSRTDIPRVFEGDFEQKARQAANAPAQGRPQAA
ncbi:DUF1127 domain-containing protein [Pseudoroseomonas cervicalis]|uniref:DUF1127 domain-containing protein n=1 Tax=Teichococcus cervicalis TaxID=204525 RepID=UPI002784BD0F|nr:DUF1127 domain-containing protein [Pseudoroseomonas cervicalis]MDQ1079908.1 uncharacterized protein YjiS (DUF1127 family) [Pseudoroseomonas cervicalis]